MKKVFFTIGFALCGVLTSFAEAQIIPLTIDSTQSSVSISIGGAPSTSQISGDLTIDLQSSGPPAGNVQITDLNVFVDESLSFTPFPFVNATTSPGDVALSMVTPGPPGTVAGNSFSQLDNSFTFVGDLDVSDPFGIAGGNQAVDLSTIDLNLFDFDSVSITQSGNVITVSSSLTFNEAIALGGFGVPVIINASFTASGIVPVAVLLGDVNLDGGVDFLDVAPFIALLIDGQFQAEGDIDDSGVVDFLDVGPFIDILMQQ